MKVKEERNIKKLRSWYLAHSFLANRRGKGGSSDRLPPPWAIKSLQMVTAVIKSDDCFLAGKRWQTYTACWKAETLLCQQMSEGYGLPSGKVWLWELDCKESRAPKNWCFQTAVLEDSWKSLVSKEIKPVNPKGDQPWIFTGRTDAEDEVPVFWSSDVNRQLIGKVPDAGKDQGQKEKRALEDEIAVWHELAHEQFNERELGQTLGDGEGQGGLAYCSPWGRKESDTTGWRNKINKGQE